MRRKRGRKLKRNRIPTYRRRKSKSKQVLTLVITLIFVVGAAFLGYSIARPVLDWFKTQTNSSDKNNSGSGWSPPTTSNVEDGSKTDNSSESTPDNPNVVSTGKIKVISGDYLISEEKLKSAVVTAKSEGYNSVIVELLENGGTLNYKSNNDVAKRHNAIKENALEIKKIYSIIKGEGVTPIARISVLSDHIVSRLDKNLGYTFQNEDAIWLDDRPESGGKAWISPFKAETTNYISSIIEEIKSAGFEEIYTADLVFPAFRNYDVEYLGELVVSNDRYNVLINLFSTIKEKFNGSTKVEIPAVDILENSADIYKPEKLTGTDLVISFDYDEFMARITSGSEKLDSYKKLNLSDLTKNVFNDIKKTAGDLTITPCIVKGSITNADLEIIINTLGELGYKDYVLIE